MKKNIFTFSVLLTTFVFSSFSQETEYQSAADYSEKGIEYFSNENYEKAFQEFSKVNYNDTAYYSLTLAALGCAIEMKKLDTILDVTTKVLEDPRYNPKKERFVIVKGYALIQKEEFEKTVKFYDRYLEEFPMSSTIHYNRSVALYALDRYDESIEALQTAIRFNPRNASAHTKLALICMEAEDYTKAALCMNMALFLSAGGEKALTLLSALEEIYAMDVDKNIGKVNYREDEDFEEIDELIKNKLAENKGYKIDAKLPYKVFKYNHMVFDQMEYDPESNGFWNQNYVRFYKEIMKNNDFAYFSYFQCIKVENPKVQKTIAKNTARITAFIEEAGDYYSQFMNERTVWNGTEYVENTLRHYGAYGFNASIKLENDVQTGPYIGYSDDGLISAEGTMDSQGKQTGLWKFYNEDGELTVDSEFKAGELDGIRHTYFTNGSRKEKFNVKDGSIYGSLELFTPYNQLRREIPFLQGKENGTLTAYYNTGEIYLKQEYMNGELNGESTYFFPDGEPMTKETYENGNLVGDYLQFYRGGAKKTVGQYLDGEPAGHWEYFHKNGQLREQGDFKNGLRIGVWKEFAKNGKLSEESNYGETGKKIGVYKEYDLDENLVLELTYKGDEIINYKTFDETGKVLSEGEKKRNELEYENYYSNGELRAKGNYYKGNRVGIWKFYNQYGVMTSDETYNENGELDGAVRYYFDNGQLETSILYKEGSRNGLFQDYFRNGALFKKGYIVDGQNVGEWEFYFRDGTLSGTEFYLDGELSGEGVSYDEKGRKTEVRTYFYGIMESVATYDTTGAILDMVVLEDGAYQNAEFKNVGGRVIQKKSYDGSESNGESIAYHGNGQIKSKGMIIDGSNHGPWEWFHENGKLNTKGTFDFGTREGEWVWYHDNGQVDVTITYDDGDVEGKRMAYSENGKISSEENYRNDELHGESYYYDEAGQVLLIRYYKDGQMLGYSYLGADKKPVAMIPFNNQNGSIEAFFANGKKSYSVEYENGFKQGKSIEYHSTGNEAVVRQFEKGQLNGERNEYYPSGKLRVTGDYYYGERHNKRISYYENGKVKSIENYIIGTLYGPAIYYKSNGTVEREVHYYNGSQIK